MIRLEKMTTETLKGLYPFLARTFPPTELKPLPKLLELVAQGCYDAWSLMEGDTLHGCALMLRAEGCEYVLLDYLAMTDKGQGFGTKCLELLKKQYPEGILVEAEALLPDLPEDILHTRRRRLAFYQRSGFIPVPFANSIYTEVYLVHLWADPFPASPKAVCARELYLNYKAQNTPEKLRANVFVEGQPEKTGGTPMNILVVNPMDAQQRTALEAIAAEHSITYSSMTEVTQEQIADAEIILGNFPIQMAPGAKKLKFLQLSFAGSDNFAAPGVLPEGVVLCNSSGAYGLAISECMLAGVLALIKRLPQYQRQQEQHLWKSAGRVTSIEGSTTLVVGLGDIGCSFAKRMNALGSTVIGIRRTVSDQPDYVSALYTLDQLDQLLPMADFVALSLPNSPQTRSIMGAKQFAEMKNEAVLVNVGRGQAIDTDALVAALNEGQIGGAVIDVVHQEPLPAEHPLWDCPNLILTPHVTGGYALDETLRRVVNISLRNLAAYLNGQPMESVVDYKTGYRKR